MYTHSLGVFSFIALYIHRDKSLDFVFDVHSYFPSKNLNRSLLSRCRSIERQLNFNTIKSVRYSNIILPVTFYRALLKLFLFPCTINVRTSLSLILIRKDDKIGIAIRTRARLA